MVYDVHMPDYQSETVTTVTRRFALQLPSNAIEVSKMEAAAARAWRVDHGNAVATVTHDAIKVTVEDDVLIYSWTVPKTEVHKPSPNDPLVHAECGHPWEEHTSAGCVVRMFPGDEDNPYCRCVTSAAQPK